MSWRRNFSSGAVVLVGLTACGIQGPVVESDELGTEETERRPPAPIVNGAEATDYPEAVVINAYLDAAEELRREEYEV